MAKSFGLKRGQFKEGVKNADVQIEVDTSEFIKGLHMWAQRVRSEAEETLKYYGYQLLMSAMGKTPWDTGNARQGWNIDVTGEGTPDFMVTIFNRVEYIVYLEYGWSGKAPDGMLRVSMHQMRGWLAQRMAKAMRPR